MRVRVSGKQTKIGETLPALARAGLEVTVEKCFVGSAEANVVFGHVGLIHRADGTRRPDQTQSPRRRDSRNLNIHLAKARAHSRAPA